MPKAPAPAFRWRPPVMMVGDRPEARSLEKQMSNQAATKKSTPKAAPPAPPKQLTKEERAKLPISDHRRPLSKAERKALTPEQKKARRESKRKARGPWKLRALKTLQRVTKKVERLGKSFSSADSVDAEHFKASVAHLTEAIEEVTALPDDFRPKGSGGGERGHAILEKGTVVQLRESKSDMYKGFIPEDGKLEVVACGEKMIVVKGSSGERLHLPRGHVEVVSEE